MNWTYRSRVLGLCTLAFFITMCARLIISPLVPSITSEYNISNTLIGLALTGMWVTYSFTQYPSGILGDKFGEKRVILLAIGGVVISSLSIALAPIYPIFLISCIVLGGLGGLHYTTATSLLSRSYKDIGKVIGIHNAGAPVAGVIIPITAIWIQVRYGWRIAIISITIAGLIIFIMLVGGIRKTPPQNPNSTLRDQVRIKSLKELLFRRPVIFTLYISFIGTFVWQGLASFLPAFLIQYMNQSPGIAGGLFSFYFIIQGVAGILIGAGSDRYGRDVMVACCMGCSSLGIIWLITTPTLISTVGAIILIGVGMSYHAAVLARFIDNFSEKEEAWGLGLVRTIYGIVGGMGSFAVGFFADFFGWGTSWIILGLLTTSVFILVILNHIFDLGY